MDQAPGRLLIIGCEKHVDRLITVNMERQRYTCASAPEAKGIREAALRLSPTIAVLDDVRVSPDLAIAELVSAGFGEIPLLKLSDQKTKPPFTLTLP